MIRDYNDAFKSQNKVVLRTMSMLLRKEYFHALHNMLYVCTSEDGMVSFFDGV